jgi:deoxynucleoside triphosphate triphosphohydrolase SAMHD1
MTEEGETKQQTTKNALLPWILTEEFQRLQDIRQLGLCSLLYLNAHHTRYAHCLGVGEWVQRLVQHVHKQEEKIIFTEREQGLLQLAAVLHDLGHLSLSHFFDNLLLPQALTFLQERKALHSEIDPAFLKHENRSTYLVSFLNTRLKELSTEEEQLVTDIILDRRETHPKQLHLFGIVANGRTGTDIDQWDYLVRDCSALGLDCKLILDFTQLLSYVVMTPQGIQYQKDAKPLITKLFQLRAYMHRHVYRHASAVALEKEMIDAFHRQATSDIIVFISSFLDKNKVPTWLQYTDRYLLHIALQDPLCQKRMASIIKEFKPSSAFLLNDVLQELQQIDVSSWMEKIDFC